MHAAQVSLRAIVVGVGEVEEVHFVLFGLPTFTAYVDAATRLLGDPLDEDEDDSLGEEEEEEQAGGQQQGPGAGKAEL
jgi:hypothetical protein